MIKVVVKSGSVLLNEPATVHIYEDKKLVKKVVAEVKLQKGADGGYYHGVELTEASV